MPKRKFVKSNTKYDDPFGQFQKEKEKVNLAETKPFESAESLFNSVEKENIIEKEIKEEKNIEKISTSELRQKPESEKDKFFKNICSLIPNLPLAQKQKLPSFNEKLEKELKKDGLSLEEAKEEAQEMIEEAKEEELKKEELKKEEPKKEEPKKEEQKETKKETKKETDNIFKRAYQNAIKKSNSEYAIFSEDAKIIKKGFSFFGKNKTYIERTEETQEDIAFRVSLQEEGIRTRDMYLVFIYGSTEIQPTISFKYFKMCFFSDCTLKIGDFVKVFVKEKISEKSGYSYPIFVIERK